MTDNFIAKDGNGNNFTVRSTDLGGGIQSTHHTLDPVLGIPHDWTEGTGVLPSQGYINIPANSNRRLLLIQNQSNTTIPVKIQSVLIDGVTTTFATLLLDPGVTTGRQGAGDERNSSTYMWSGQIIVGQTGMNGLQIMVVEG